VPNELEPYLQNDPIPSLIGPSLPEDSFESRNQSEGDVDRVESIPIAQAISVALRMPNSTRNLARVGLALSHTQRQTPFLWILNCSRGWDGFHFAISPGTLVAQLCVRNCICYCRISLIDAGESANSE
jgi:hypothetical protein